MKLKQGIVAKLRLKILKISFKKVYDVREVKIKNFNLRLKD